MPRHCSSCITLCLIASEWAWASSPLSQPIHPPHSACLHLQVAMATGCLASQSLNAQAQRQAILADGFDQPSRLHCWIYQGFVSSLLCGFFFEKKWIRLALWTCTKMSSNSEIFDKWFIMVYHDERLIPALLSLLLFSVHVLRVCVEQYQLCQMWFVISVSFWTKFCCTAFYNSSKEKHLSIFLRSREAHFIS